MARTFAKLSASLLFVSSLALPQGLTTSATKDDWEEVNFEFNMSVLTDGYPSLLRMAELLNKNPGHKVKITGHAYWIGSHPYNDKLGLARANTIKSFLEKYGARSGQATVESQGKRSPKFDNNQKVGRWMNRRAELVLTDGQGKVVGAGGVADAIKALEALAKQQEECCSKILNRLNKLDDILAALNDLKNQNSQLKRDVDELKDMARKGHAAAPAPSPACLLYTSRCV